MAAHPTWGTNDIQNNNTPKLCLGKVMTFIVVAYRSMGDGLFIEVEITQRQLHHQKLLQHGSQFIIHQTQGPRAHGTTCRQLVRLKGIFFRQLGFSLFLYSSSSLCFLPVDLLVVWASSRQLWCLILSLRNPNCICLERERFGIYDQFQQLPETFGLFISWA